VENEVLPASDWNYALSIDRDNPSASIQVVAHEMPENPFIQETTPVQLIVSARKLPTWQYALNGLMATDPPYSPVETSSPEEQVTLIPYGAETLRATCLPYIGKENGTTTAFNEDFTNGQDGWVQYGGSWFVKDGEYVAGNVEASHPCSKSVYPATCFSDFIFEADVQINSNNGDAGLMFRTNRVAFAPDDYNGYYMGISKENKRVELGKADGSWHSLTSIPMEINTNQWYHLKIVAKGANIEVYIDNKDMPEIVFSDPSFTVGSIGVRSYNALARWDNISVVSLSGSAIPTIKDRNKILLYPNPVTNRLSINIPQTGHLSVYDSGGKQLFFTGVQPGITVLDADQYNPGIYFVELVMNNGITSCGRFIKY
jgi:hypothetical protein